jgi:hypothetical protein
VCFFRLCMDCLLAILLINIMNIITNKKRVAVNMNKIFFLIELQEK